MEAEDSGDAAAESGRAADVPNEVFRALCELERRRGAGARGTLAELRALRAGGPEAFPAALERCAETVLGGAETQAPGGVVDSLLGVIAGAAHEAEEADGAPGRLLGWLLGRLDGGSTGRAPKARAARRRGAELLRLLLPKRPPEARCSLAFPGPSAGAGASAAGAAASQGAASQSARSFPSRARKSLAGRSDRLHLQAPLAAAAAATLSRLACDKTPAVRLSATRGLAALGGASAASLARLAAADASPAVRRTALSGLAQVCAPGHAGATLWATGRCLDAAPEVRRHLYSSLRSSYKRALEEAAAAAGAGAVPASPPPPPPPRELLRVGLKDIDPEARFLCEATLCSWLRAASHGSGCPGARRALVGLLASLEVEQSEANEAVAERVVLAVASQGEWRPILEAEASKQLVGAGVASDAQATGCGDEACALLWRIGAAMGGGAAPEGREALRAAALSQIHLAIGAARVAELRQLLRAAVDAAGPEPDLELLPAAARILMECPLHDEQGLSDSGRRTVRLAITLVRKALPQRRPGHDADALFFRVVSEALERLWGPAPDEDADPGEESDCLSAWHAALKKASPAASMREVGARFDASLAETRGQDFSRDPAEQAAVRADAAALYSLTSRALCIVEEALGQSDACLEFDAPASFGGEVVERWLKPTLVRADAAEPILGGDCWFRLRAQAVKCMALNALTESASAAAHWPFFMSVLARYNPTVTLYRLGSSVAEAAGHISETCLLFLSDTVLLYGARSPEFADGGAARQLFGAVAPLLGPPVSAMHTMKGLTCGADAGSGAVGPLVAESPRQAGGVSVPSGFRRRLAERLCTLLLFGCAWDFGGGSDAESVAEDGQLPRPLPAASWATAWLLLEAFYQPFPMSAAGSAARRMEEAEEAAHRSRLLCFFGCLGRASPVHAGLLVAGVEVLLSTELWKLGARTPFALGNNRQWRPLQLPRLLRLVCRQLRVGCSADAAASHCAARLWLEGVWRPLALLCLKQRASDTDPCLPEALLAALASAVEGPGAEASGSAALLAEGGPRAAAAAEVSSAARAIAARWSGGGKAAAPVVDSSQNGAPRRVAQQLLRLASELGCGQTDGREGGVGGGDGAHCAWAEAAESRRGHVRESLAELQVDASEIVAAATDALRKCARARRSSMCARAQRRSPPAAGAASKAGRPAQGGRKAAKTGKRPGIRMFPDYDGDSAALADDPVECSQEVPGLDSLHGAPTPARKRARVKREKASDDDSD